MLFFKIMILFKLIKSLNQLFNFFELDQIWSDFDHLWASSDLLDEVIPLIWGSGFVDAEGVLELFHLFDFLEHLCILLDLRHVLKGLYHRAEVRDPLQTLM